MAKPEMAEIMTGLRTEDAAAAIRSVFREINEICVVPHLPVAAPSLVRRHSVMELSFDALSYIK